MGAEMGRFKTRVSKENGWGFLGPASRTVTTALPEVGEGVYRYESLIICLVLSPVLQTICDSLSSILTYRLPHDLLAFLFPISLLSSFSPPSAHISRALQGKKDPPLTYRLPHDLLELPLLQRVLLGEGRLGRLIPIYLDI
jgi:hypothetical protein